MTDEKFKKLLLKKEFIEWAVVHGHCYGTLKAPLKKHRESLLDIDVQGAMQIKKILPRSILIFILPPSFKELKRRLVRRHTDNLPEIKRRLKIAKKELGYLKRYDYAVINRNINQALREIDSIIVAQRLRVEK
jgi:guanylate kinase